jgi:6-pyruvoyltetrahydropterin/6-carboxytetrahydropterin synthase
LITITRRLRFEAGHRVYQHESKCANPHGHSYEILIEATAPELDRLGRVIDFSVLKERIGGWIEDKWDHGFLYYTEDRDVAAALMAVGGKRFAMSANPTAENMADYLLREVCPRVLEGTGVRVTRVILHETENCSAEASL